MIAPMNHRRRITKLSLQATPMQVAAAWPIDCPLIMLHSGRHDRRWARWSVLAEPTGFYRFDGRSHWIGRGSTAPGVDFSHDPLRDLDAITAATGAQEGGTLPFVGGWIGYFSYDLGRWIEPAAADRPPPAADRSWPLIELAYCPNALVFDNLTGQWHAVGDVPLDAGLTTQNLDDETFTAGPMTSSVNPDEYLTMVSKTIDYIAAGDIFQANITQRLCGTFEGSTRALGRSALALSQAWYGAYLELPAGRCIVSLSPELFLDADFNSRAVITRPIKGTRPITVDARDLLESPKDAAELHMIVDLMRNDLGRVCEYGSVRVPQVRAIETHPTVHHGVAQITGSLRADVSLGRLLGATFPGGSVTGAPKIRAMQIIDELEPVRRGPYCGAIGWISDHGLTRLNMAIRTIALTGRRETDVWNAMVGTLDYGVGGGIVADSHPIAEYRESLDKAAVLRLVLADRDAIAPQRAT